MKSYFFFFLFLLLTLCAEAQQKQGANWLFGGWSQTNIPGTHLNFNGQIPVAIPYNFDYNDNIGVATVSYKNGQILFF